MQCTKHAPNCSIQLMSPTSVTKTCNAHSLHDTNSHGTQPSMTRPLKTYKQNLTCQYKCYSMPNSRCSTPYNRWNLLRLHAKKGRMLPKFFWKLAGRSALTQTQASRPNPAEHPRHALPTNSSSKRIAPAIKSRSKISYTHFHPQDIFTITKFHKICRSGGGLECLKVRPVRVSNKK